MFSFFLYVLVATAHFRVTHSQSDALKNPDRFHLQINNTIFHCLADAVRLLRIGILLQWETFFFHGTIFFPSAAQTFSSCELIQFRQLAANDSKWLLCFSEFNAPSAKKTNHLLLTSHAYTKKTSSNWASGVITCLLSLFSYRIRVWTFLCCKTHYSSS